MRYFVGIHGRFKSGKDTLAGWLAAELSGWTRVYIRHFAAELREAIEVISGGRILAANTWTEADKAQPIPTGIDWNLKLAFPCMKDGERLKWEKEVLPRMALEKQTVGKLLQDIGLLGRQVEGTDVWVDRFEAKLPPEEAGFSSVLLVPDLRFPNEVDWLMRHAASLIKVDPEGRIIKDMSGRDTGHISEVALKDFKGWNLVVKNGGTLEQYKEKSLQALYYVNAQASGKYLSVHELLPVFKTRLDELEADRPALYSVPASVHSLEEVAREEYRRGLLGDYILERRILGKSVKTLVRYTIPPLAY